MKLQFNSVLIAVLLTSLNIAHASTTIEVLHSWNSNGDLNALETLKNQMAEQGVLWKKTETYDKDNFESLNSRVFNGDAPAAVEVKDLDYKQWARLGFLANLNRIATTGNWDSLIPKEVSEVSKYDGKYVSLPVSVHRTNWLWVNESVLKSYGLNVPETWKEFDVIADTLTSKRYPVISIPDDKDHYAQLFESVVLSVGGAQLYRDVFIRQDVMALKSTGFKAAMARFYRLVELIKRSNATARYASSYSFLKNESAFVFGGDWVSNETNQAGLKFRDKYECEHMPGIENQFIFKSDSFVFFNMPNIQEKVSAQVLLAQLMMSETFQIALNTSRGSITARTDLPTVGYDYCARKALREINSASANGTLLPSVVYGMATATSVSDNFTDQVYELAINRLPVDESVKLLSRKIRLGNYIMK